MRKTENQCYLKIGQLTYSKKLWDGGITFISEFLDITWGLAVISITGSIFNIKKNVLCFYFWCFCEFLCFIIDINNKQYGRAFLDMFCFAINIYGIIAWSKEKKL